LTGFPEKPLPLKPNFGSILAKQRSQARTLPPFISIARGMLGDATPLLLQGYGGGSLSKSYDPVLVGCGERGEVEIPSLTLLEGVTPDRVTDRKTLLTQVDGASRHLENAGFDHWDRAH